MVQDSAATNVLVTGGTGGLGSATVKELARNDNWHIVLASRTREKATTVRDDILGGGKLGQGTKLSIASGFDMTAPDKLRSAVDGLEQPRFDIVFLGAGGVVFGPQRQTIRWNGRALEKTVFQNVVGGHIVMSELQKRRRLALAARVVVAGGEGARGIRGMIAKPAIATPRDLRRFVLAEEHQARYRPMDAIGVSKLVSALWCQQMARVFAGKLSVVWFTPGLTFGTQGLSGLPPAKRWMMQRMLKLLGRLGLASSPESGGRRFADCLEGKIGKNGDLLGAPEGRATGPLVSQMPMHAAFGDLDLQDELWEILAEVAGPFGE